MSLILRFSSAVPPLAPAVPPLAPAVPRLLLPLLFRQNASYFNRLSSSHKKRACETATSGNSVSASRWTRRAEKRSAFRHKASADASRRNALRFSALLPIG